MVALSVLWLSPRARQSIVQASTHSWYVREEIRFDNCENNSRRHTFQPGVFTLPFPYWHQLSRPKDTPTEELSAFCLNQLHLLLSQQTTPKDTAAIIIESVIGEGGYVPAPPEFLKGLREICDQHGIMLIIDEVQSGFGRTGKNFAIEYSGVKPDIMTVAKGLANGFPLSGIISRRELTDTLAPGSMVCCVTILSFSNIIYTFTL